MRASSMQPNLDFDGSALVIALLLLLLLLCRF